MPLGKSIVESTWTNGLLLQGGLACGAVDDYNPAMVSPLEMSIVSITAAVPFFLSKIGSGSILSMILHHAPHNVGMQCHLKKNRIQSRRYTQLNTSEMSASYLDPTNRFSMILHSTISSPVTIPKNKNKTNLKNSRS